MFFIKISFNQTKSLLHDTTSLAAIYKKYEKFSSQ